MGSTDPWAELDALWAAVKARQAEKDDAWEDYLKADCAAEALGEDSAGFYDVQAAHRSAQVRLLGALEAHQRRAAEVVAALRLGGRRG